MATWVVTMEITDIKHLKGQTDRTGNFLETEEATMLAMYNCSYLIYSLMDVITLVLFDFFFTNYNMKQLRFMLSLSP